VRIGLISDTHIPEARPDLPKDIFKVFAGVDMILHAGDIHALEVLDWLEDIAPVFAVRGNGDVGDGTRPRPPDDPRLNEDIQIIEAGGLRIGMRHSIPWAGYAYYPTIESIMDRFFETRLDLIVVCDTHVAEIEDRNGILVVNPGSPTLPNNTWAKPGTVALLDIVDGVPRPRIVQLSE